jgi:hypothetical protein
MVEPVERPRCGHEQPAGHCEPERLRSFQVKHRFVLGRRLHGELGRFGAAQNAVHVGCRLEVLLGGFCAVGHVRPPAATKNRYA